MNVRNRDSLIVGRRFESCRARCQARLERDEERGYDYVRG
jgi:hypothetical protein